jgi:hypothetical protein
MLRKLTERYEGQPIVIVLDNARYLESFSGDVAKEMLLV